MDLLSVAHIENHIPGFISRTPSGFSRPGEGKHSALFCSQCPAISSI
uniref:Uncharacterized protein n=1 Tax=Utricularia reniformis TaxID=192314 RepID=A0A1Y0B4B3_9LAMI|nr:hypothetical protein AEK19_MT2146 [Utricularia reniformis]ART32296.1 hypothetical protein AEK19_MT2146 [Utricularia reniformis]